MTGPIFIPRPQDQLYITMLTQHSPLKKFTSAQFALFKSSKQFPYFIMIVAYFFITTQIA